VIKQSRETGFTGWIGEPVFNPRWEFEVWQDDIQVAGGEGPDREFIQREGWNYAAQYAQDGPCRLTFKHVVEEHEIAGRRRTKAETTAQGVQDRNGKWHPF
jgi:hypothetical protein